MASSTAAISSASAVPVTEDSVVLSVASVVTSTTSEDSRIKAVVERLVAAGNFSPAEADRYANLSIKPVSSETVKEINGRIQELRIKMTNKLWQRDPERAKKLLRQSEEYLELRNSIEAQLKPPVRSAPSKVAVSSVSAKAAAPSHVVTPSPEEDIVFVFGDEVAASTTATSTQTSPPGYFMSALYAVGRGATAVATAPVVVPVTVFHVIFG